MKMRHIVYVGASAALAIWACDMPTSVDCKENRQCLYAGAAGAESGGVTSTKTSTGGKGGTNTGTSAGGASSSPPCDGECTGATPVCNTTSDTCVACVASTDCKDSTKTVCDTGTNTCVACLASTDCKESTKPQCNTSSKSCVACLSNSDCTTAAASLCNTTTNTCGPCSVDADCTQVSGKNACLTGVTGQTNQCVTCTVANETACIVGTVANSCNPKTNTCTSTAKGSRKTCQSCVADSECGNGSGVVDTTKRCVPMTFNGAAHGTGGYCLQTVDSVGTTGCSAPYTVPITTTSLSGAASTKYCGINQTATTCEALLDLFNSKTCSLPTDCGGGSGGLCKTVGTSPNRCTIPCISGAECLLSPAPGSTCSDTTGGWCQ